MYGLFACCMAVYSYSVLPLPDSESEVYMGITDGAWNALSVSKQLNRQGVYVFLWWICGKIDELKMYNALVQWTWW